VLFFATTFSTACFRAFSLIRFWISCRQKDGRFGWLAFSQVSVTTTRSKPPHIARSPSTAIQGTAVYIHSLHFNCMTTEIPHGSCSHPNCPWTGPAVSYNRHKNGAGIKRPRPAAHPDCTCCSFVPPSSYPVVLSRLQATMALLPKFEHASVHAHLQGEFHRRADISGRT